MFGSSPLKQELLQRGKALLENRTCRVRSLISQGLLPAPQPGGSVGCVWAVIFSWLQKETDEEYPALCPHHSNKGYSNNLRHCSLFFNLLMSSVLLHPCQSKCLELISKPGARLITKSSRSRETSDTHTAALQVSPAKHLSTQNQTSSIQQTQTITS